jgi:hypothetical protein
MEADKMQTVFGRVRVRVVPLGGVYTVAPAPLIAESHQAREESTASRAPRNDGHILRRIERKRVHSGA